MIRPQDYHAVDDAHYIATDDHYQSSRAITVPGNYDHPNADHTDLYADDCDVDGGGNRLHCLLLSHQHCLGETGGVELMSFFFKCVSQRCEDA